MEIDMKLVLSPTTNMGRIESIELSRNSFHLIKQFDKNRPKVGCEPRVHCSTGI